jgi:glycosyltransferase involved in cell wall biosynthesis
LFSKYSVSAYSQSDPLSPLVTIAIPTYNRADSYLPLTLQSALAQSYRNIEILVSDNASTDSTETLVKGIGDPRLRYFRHSINIGASNNFNFCFKQATGQYLLLLHDDDLIDVDMIESCVNAAAGREVGVIRTGVRLIDEKGGIIAQRTNQTAGVSTGEFIRAWLAGRSPIYLCNTLFNTRRLVETGGFRSKHDCYQDTMAVMRLAAKYGRLDLPDVKASFRQHAGEMTLARRIDEWCEDSQELLDLLCDLAPQEKSEIRRAGLRFFSGANYRRARMAGRPLARISASIRVLRHFRCRHLPSIRHVAAIFEGTRLHEWARFMKRNWKCVFSQT